jgi:hypothetical protein
MVARIAVANAAPAIRDRIAAVVTFGDPVSRPVTDINKMMLMLN